MTLRLRTFGGLSLELDGVALSGAAAQRRRLALLAILAAAGPMGVGRERVTLLLWPDSGADRARHALAQLLYILRQSLPAGAVVASAAELRLDEHVIASDVREFDDAVAAGDHERAAACYRGPFLDGVHLADAPEFERWTDGERLRRARAAFAALEAQATTAGARGDHAAALRWSQRLAELDPLDARGALLLMRALAAVGNRAGALQHASLHERLVRDELGIPPGAAILQLAAELRARPEVPAAPPGGEPLAAPLPGAPASTTAPSPPEPTVETVPRRRRRSARVFGAAVGAALVALGALVAVGARTRVGATAAAHEGSRPAVAVLPFVVRGDPAYGYLSEGLVDLLSADLDHAGELRAVDPKALLGYTARLAAHGVGPQAGQVVAERFGARWFVLGSVVEAAGRLRVSATLYQRDSTAAPDRSAVLAQATVEGTAAQLFELVDRLALALLADVHRGPRDRLTRTAALASPSLAVLKAYLAGEQQLRAGRYADAMEAFARAVRGDSTFALAHYRRAVAAEWAGRLDEELDAADQAARRSERLSEHDRLLVHAFQARRRGAADEAERLYRRVVAEYPDDVEAWYQLGEVLFHNNAYRGRSFAESRRAWERVLALEPGHWQALLHLARVASREERRAELDTLLGHALRLAPAAERQELQAFRAFALGEPDDQRAALRALRTADDAVVWQSLWRVAVYTHDLAGAERIARLLTEPARAAAARQGGHEALMLLRLGQGRLRSAAAAGARVTRPEPWSARVGNPYFLALGLAPVDTAAAVALRDRFTRWNDSATHAADRLLLAGRDVQPLRRAFLSGLLGVRVRDFDAARDQARALHAVRGTPPVRGLAALFAAALEADALRAAGRPADALAVLERAPIEVPTELSGAFGIGPYAAWLRAEALRDVGRDEEALAWYASRADLFVGEMIYLAPAYVRAGEIHERSGEPARAVASYRRFLALWADADPELQPLVEATARRVELLCGRHAASCPR